MNTIDPGEAVTLARHIAVSFSTSVSQIPSGLVKYFFDSIEPALSQPSVVPLAYLTSIRSEINLLLTTQSAPEPLLPNKLGSPINKSLMVFYSALVAELDSRIETLSRPQA